MRQSCIICYIKTWLWNIPNQLFALLKEQKSGTGWMEVHWLRFAFFPYQFFHLIRPSENWISESQRVWHGRGNSGMQCTYALCDCAIAKLIFVSLSPMHLHDTHTMAIGLAKGNISKSCIREEQIKAENLCFRRVVRLIDEGITEMTNEWCVVWVCAKVNVEIETINWVAGPYALTLISSFQLPILNGTDKSKGRKCLKKWMSLVTVPIPVS